ncbi:metal-binding integral membrane protein-like protein [Polaromonas sp. JS666]|nr:metal-binding integral membrane protein-like protein [Polaromonas sp. JS666]
MTVPVDATLEAVLRRDRLVVVTALTAVIALSWAYLLVGAGMGMSAFEMTRMSQLGIARGMSEWGMAGMAMMTRAVWTPDYAVLMFFMWWVMMVAMMLPGVPPMILLFATVNRKQRDTGHPYVATSIFAFGYLAAGVYQLTPIKHACLRHCRSPLGFLSTHWRRGARGALRMGLLHGAFCVGCCWAPDGADVFWRRDESLLDCGPRAVRTVRKNCPCGAPAGHWLGYATGVALLVWGAGMLALAF